MNRREAAIITAYTGCLLGPFDAFHAYVEELLGRPVWTHELANKDLAEKIKELAKPDMIDLAQSAADLPQEQWERAEKYTSEDASAAVDEMMSNLPDNAVVIAVHDKDLV